MTLFFVCLLSAIFGSFLNMLIYRLPRHLNWISSSSRCISCHHSLSFLSLIPIISYCFSRGSCRHCHASIPIRYLLIELWMVAISAYLFLTFNFSILFAIYWLGIFCITGIFFTDLETYIIPDIFTFCLFSLGLIYRAYTNTLLSGVWGSLFGFGLFFLVWYVSLLVYKTEGIGFGDVKLMGALGFYFGLMNTIILSYLSFLLGGIIALLLLATKLKGRKDAIPFGPFICVAAGLTAIYGPELWSRFFAFT